MRLLSLLTLTSATAGTAFAKLGPTSMAETAVKMPATGEALTHCARTLGEEIFEKSPERAEALTKGYLFPNSIDWHKGNIERTLPKVFEEQSPECQMGMKPALTDSQGKINFQSKKKDDGVNQPILDSYLQRGFDHIFDRVDGKKEVEKLAKDEL
jgi:hypothetical protein